MGEEKKEEVKKEGENSKEEKKEEEEEVEEIVLKVDMHCEACARKVARALKGFQGVEQVTADCKASKVVVKGKTADPAKVCQRIQKKSGRKVEIISPLPKPPPPPSQEKNDENKDPPKEDKKLEPPEAITVALSVRMHCEACAQALKRRIHKIKGVESVTTDVSKDRVVVKGFIVDPEKLVSDVYKKTRKQASVIKEDKKEEEAKAKEGEAGGDDDRNKQEDQKAEEKKEEEGSGRGGGGGGGGGEDSDKVLQDDDDIKKSEYWGHKDSLVDFAYPPQFFSDENPNACSLM